MKDLITKAGTPQGEPMMLYDWALMARTLGYLTDLKLVHLRDFVQLYREYKAEVGFEENYYVQMAVAEHFYPRLRAFGLTSPLHSLVEFHRMTMRFNDQGVKAI